MLGGSGGRGRGTNDGLMFEWRFKSNFFSFFFALKYFEFVFSTVGIFN